MLPRARPLVAAWIALALFILAVRPFAVELDGQYRGAFVTIRPFMRAYNLVVLSLHLVVVALALVAAARLSARVAMGVLAAAGLGVTAFLLAPILIGDGPFVPGSPPLLVYRCLVFAPPLLRDLGLAGISLACVSVRARPLVVLFAIADASIIAFAWRVTSIAVLASAHPSVITWLGLAPLTALAWITIDGLRRQRAMP